MRFNIPPKAQTALIGGSAMALALGVIMPWEGKENDPYLDIVNVKTVCYGETLNVQDRHYTDAECEAMLKKAVSERYMKPVMACTPSIASKPEVLAAATSLAYNIGTQAYCKSTVDRRFDAGDIKGGCDAFMMWNRAGGREVRGLTNRRAAERNLCLKGVS